MDFGDKDYQTAKQLKYEAKLAKNLLESLGVPGPTVTSIMRDNGQAFGLDYINKTYFDSYNILFHSLKLKDPLSLADLIKSEGKRSQIWSTYLDLLDNISDEGSVFLIFDNHGDGIGDLVLHNNFNLAPSSRSWFMNVWRSYNDGPYYIQTFKSLLESISEGFRIY